MESGHFIHYQQIMESGPFPDWFFFAALGWVTIVLVASILIRRSRGKPIIPRVSNGALFTERAASAAWANNCLLVWITSDTLFVTPKFPFNLLFLPEIYGLERQIPLRLIHDVREHSSLIGNNVVVRYDGDRKLGLKLKRPQDFIAVMRDHGIQLV